MTRLDSLLGVGIGRPASTLAAVLGLVALAGWVFDLPLLRSVIPGAVEMKANTALALIASSLALFLLSARRPTHSAIALAQTLAFAVTLLGLATFSQYVFGWKLGIDELVFRDTGAAYNQIRGRMSPFSAIGFAWIGLALICRPYPEMRPLTWILAGGVLLIGAVSLVGYIWNADELVTDRWLPPVAVHTAAAFVLLALGAMSAPAGAATAASDQRRALSRIELKILAGMIGSMLLLLLGGALTYRATAEVQTATSWVEHAQQVRISIKTLDATISDTELGQRNYLITGQARFREDFNRLASQTQIDFLALAQLVADNAAQSERTARLRQLIARKLDWLAAVIACYDAQGLASARKCFEAGDDSQFMREINSLTQEMDGYEEGLLRLREKTLAASRLTTLVSLLFTLTLAASAFALQFTGIRREMKARLSAEEARVAAEAAVRLREAELSRFKETLDQTLDCIFLFRPDTLRFTYANRGAMLQVGYSAAELLEMTPLDLRPGDSEADFRALLEPLLNHASASLITETLHRRKDGTDIPVEVHLQLARMADGESLFVKVVRDISARRQADEALRNSNTRVRTILDTVADGIITIDAHGIVETINPAAERIFGYDASEIVDRNIKLLMPEPFRSQHDGFLESFRATGQARIIGIGRELKGQRKDGSVLPIELTVSEMELGGERHFTGVVRDISRRKEAEDQLNRFFALSLDMLCIAGADGYFKRVSPAFTKTLGWSVEELLTRPFLEFVHPDDRAATIRTVARQIEAGESILQFENRYRHRDGSWRVLSWKSVPHEGGLMYAAARDITSRIEAEQALVAARDEAVRASNAKGVFMATMSHEIRTPLSGLLGMLELLGLSQLDAEQRETLDTARESGRGVVRIIDDVLDHAKIEAGKLEILPEVLSIPQLLRRLLNNYHAVASAKGLTLTQVDDPRISPALLADPVRLLQILGNFVSNAVKFTATGGIEVRAEWLGRTDGADTVRLSVKDSGIGIDAAAQSRLFQPFEQAAANTSRLYGGTGLGLAISRRLAEMMGGEIAVDSAPGRGTTFSLTLRLPITDSLPAGLAGEAASPARGSLQLSPSGKENPQVLAVDDNPTNRTLLARQLGVLGLQATAAADGHEALALWQQGEFGVVITDCNMPGMDGYALASAIREIEIAEGRPRTLIIAWTANALADAAARCRAAGMDNILTKPAALAELRDLLANALGERAGTPATAGGEATDRGDAENPIDPGRFAELASLFGDDPLQIREFVDAFRVSAAGIASELRRAAAAGDAAAAAATAHKLKSSSRSVGALSLSDLCASVEQAAAAGETQTLNELLPPIEAAIAAVDRCLDSLAAVATKPSETGGKFDA